MWIMQNIQQINYKCVFNLSQDAFRDVNVKFFLTNTFLDCALLIVEVIVVAIWVQ